MKKNILIIVAMIPVLAFSQTKNDTIKSVNLEEVVLSKKIVKDFGNLPNQVEIIGQKEIEFQNFQTTAEMLSNSGKLFVQKSQQGGGSPSIRGFEASRVLLLVDGIRMNNLIFRAGHLQNVITVDENMLENVGIFYGPSSTLFGSDALGGTVNMNTKSAKFLSETNKKFSGGIITRYGSVNEEKSVAFDLNYAKDNFASLTIFSYNDFGDLKMGEKKNHNGKFFGERPTYVETINGVDQVVTNDNKYVQKFTGYKQYNALQKFAYKTSSGFEHQLNLQFSTTSDVPRYDRLSETSGSGLKHAEWYYGPQQRILGIYSLSKEKAFLNSDMTFNLAYQNVKESRHNRRFGNYNLQHREENVNVYSATLEMERKFSKGELFYGFESYFETLTSSAYGQNINTGEVSSLDSRYPNGDNNMFRNDLYISYNENISTKTFWNIGGRIGYTTLKSSISDDTYFPLPFNNISQGNLTYSGTLGIKHKPSQNFAIKGNLSSGYRVPNIDDLAKIFESGGGYLVVPNEDLKPEKTITTDFGIEVQSDSQKIKFETIYYYTRLFDAIVTDNFTYEGQSEIMYDGTLSQVLANQNQGRAFITGISTNFFAKLITQFDFSASFNYTLGRIIEDEGNKPLDHIAPYYGKIGLTYRANKLNLEAYMLYNGKKDIEDYYLNGEDNEQYAPNGGMPAWETYNFKSSFMIFKQATLYAGVENILDTQYRVFASGINAPGRNIYGGIQYRF